MTIVTFYLSNSAAGYTPTTFKGTWNDTTQAVTNTKKLSLSPTGSSTSPSLAETSTSPTFQICLARWVSDPLYEGTISGLFNFIIKTQESAADADMCTVLHVWVTTGDSDTNRGTLISNFVDTTKEWSTTSTATALSSAQTMSSVNIQAGDRVVVEMGYRAQNSTATSKTGTINIGNTIPVSGEGDTTASRAGYITMFVPDATPSRFYLLNTTAPLTPGAWSATWDATVGSVTKAIDTRKTGLSDHAEVSVSEVSTTNNWDVALGRFVSGPLQAQTISGLWGYGIGAYESSLSINDFLRIYAYVVASDGTTVRGVLFDYTGTTELTASVITATQFVFNAGTVTAVSVTDGDYLVLEVGYQAQNTSATSFGTTLVYGTGGTLGDVVGSGDIGSSYDSWIEFQDNILFQSSGSLTVHQAPVNVLLDVDAALQVYQTPANVLVDPAPALLVHQAPVEVLTGGDAVSTSDPVAQIMRAIHVASRRTAMTGFEYGEFGKNIPSGSSIPFTFSTTTKRTGTYALRVQAASGGNTGVNLSPTNTSVTSDTCAHRIYFNIITLPITARVIALLGSTSLVVSGVPGIRLHPDGHLDVYNGSVLASGATLLQTGQWYRLEIAVATSTSLSSFSMRLDGVEEIPWTDVIVNFTQTPDFMVGAIDSVAATFDMYWDDYAGDFYSWPGPGRVKLIFPTGLHTNNTNFTVTGAATKYEAVDETPANDITDYMSTGTTTSQIQYFTWPSLPGDCVAIRGMQGRMKMKRIGATNGSVNFSYMMESHIGTSTNVTSTSIWQYIEWCQNFTDIAGNSGGITNDRWTNFRLGVGTASANTTDITQFGLEIDYDDTAGAEQNTWRRLITGFESGEIPLGTLIGTVGIESSYPRTGRFALRSVPSGITASYWSVGNNFDSPAAVWVQFAFMVKRRPSSGTTARIIRIYTGSSAVTGCAVRMDSSGFIQLEDTSGLIGSLSASAIPLDTWVQFAIKYIRPSGNSVSDGLGDVRINGVSVLSSTTMISTSGNSSLGGMEIGSTITTSTTGWDFVYDDFVIDGASFPEKFTRIYPIRPTAPGGNTGTGFTTGPNIGLSHWSTLDEVLDNPDFDYTNTGLTSAAVDSYTTQNIPALADAIYSVSMVAQYKNNDTSTGLIYPYLRTSSRAVTTLFTSASVSDWIWLVGMLPYISEGGGVWTPELVNSAELAIMNRSTTHSMNVSKFLAEVEYSEGTPVAGVGRSMIVIAG